MCGVGAVTKQVPIQTSTGGGCGGGKVKAASGSGPLQGSKGAVDGAAQAVAGVGQLGATSKPKSKPAPAPDHMSHGSHGAHGPVAVGHGGGGDLIGHQGAGDNVVRDRNLAQQTLDRARSVAAGLATPALARAAGYQPIPGTNHWGLVSGGLGSGARDLSQPNALIFDGDRMVGLQIMAINHDPLPDYGAGLWHKHGDSYGMIHVWTDGRPIENSFGGM
jgi:hypothetical protein